MKKKGKRWLLGAMGGLCLLGLVGCMGSTDHMDLQVALPERVTMEYPSEALIVPTEEQLLDRYMETLSLEEKVGQLFYVTVGNLEQPVGEAGNTQLAVDDAIRRTMAQYHPGGVILMGDNLESDAQVQTLNWDLQEASTIPLFIGVDEEGGMVSRLGGTAGITTTNVGSMAAIGRTGDSNQAYQIGTYLGSELKRLGFNMDFAPVADVLTNAGNYEIGSRSFGSEPELVSDMVTAEIGGLQSEDISAVAKHFPGHGGVIGNSHKNLQYVDATQEELETEMLPSFQAAAEADVDAVLVSHLVLDTVEADTPSSLSDAVVEGILRTELNYQGVVITDSFQMGSITENYTQADAAVRAVQAGNDMILMPLDYDACYQGVLQAVQTGSLTEEQIDQACRRILQTKIKRGILILRSDSPQESAGTQPSICASYSSNR